MEQDHGTIFGTAPSSGLLAGDYSRDAWMQLQTGRSMKDTKKVIEEAYAAFNSRDIDGALVGGASLDADEFLAIARA